MATAPSGQLAEIAPSPSRQLPALCLVSAGVCVGCGRGDPAKGGRASGDPRVAATSNLAFALGRELQEGLEASELI